MGSSKSKDQIENDLNNRNSFLKKNDENIIRNKENNQKITNKIDELSNDLDSNEMKKLLTKLKNKYRADKDDPYIEKFHKQIIIKSDLNESEKLLNKSNNDLISKKTFLDEHRNEVNKLRIKKFKNEPKFQDLIKKNQIKNNKIVRKEMDKSIEINYEFTNESDPNEWKNLLVKLKKNESLNSYAKSKKRIDFQNTNELIQFFSKFSNKTNIDLAWLIYLWIAENIEYNLDTFDKPGTTDPETVLKTGQTVCEGYVNLFMLICKAVNFECKKLIGYTKGASYKIGQTFNDKEDHTWLALKLDDKYFYIDPTWSNSSKKFNPYWFLTPAQFFKYSHFAPFFQLQEKKISLKEFEELPYFKPDFHLFDLECITHNKSIICSSNTPLFLEFSAPDDVSLIAHLKENDLKIENKVLVQKNLHKIKYGIIVFTPKEHVSYELIIFAKKNSYNLYNDVAKFKVSSNTSIKNEFIPSYSLVFKFDIKCLSHQSVLIDYSTIPLFIEFLVPEDILLIASLNRDDNKIENSILIQKEKFKNGFLVFTSEINVDYMLKFYAKHSNESENSYLSIGDFLITRRGDKPNENIPKYILGFNYDIKCLSHFNKLIRIESNPEVLIFQAPRHTQILIELKNNKNELTVDRLMQQRSLNQENYEIKVILPFNHCFYDLIIYAKNSKHETTFEHVTEFKLIRTNEPYDDRLFLNFFNNDNIESYIFSPIYLNLKLNQLYLFKIYVKNAVQLALKDKNSTWYYLELEKDCIWSLNKSFDSIGHVNLFARTDKNSTSFNAICSYCVI
jgi:hypothetical protein